MSPRKWSAPASPTAVQVPTSPMDRGCQRWVGQQPLAQAAVRAPHGQSPTHGLHAVYWLSSSPSLVPVASPGKVGR